MTVLTLSACTGQHASEELSPNDDFNYVVDQFADLQILRYKVPGFESLTLKQKQLLYHLSKAALMGRDILYDQNCKYNLAIRRTLEAIYTNYKGNRDDDEFKALETYLKSVWFSIGIHQHYGEEKFRPGFSAEFFKKCVESIDASKLPLREGETVSQLVAELSPVICTPSVLGKRTVQSGDADVIKVSANNYYEGDLSTKEVNDFYTKLKGNDTITPPSYGLNSRLVKENGKIYEKVWKVGGLYSAAIEKIVAELEKAAAFAENDAQKKIIDTLIDYYRTGDLKTFDAYSILWVEDTRSEVDFVNGFIETYGDPLGRKASWESTVNFINKEATTRTKIVSDNAQWFEDHSPVDKRFKKETVKGVSAKVITVTMLGGDCYPATPIGINLPNADWIRRDHGSKSVTIENITEAYDKASLGNGFNEEFVWSDTERNAIKKYGFITVCAGKGLAEIFQGLGASYVIEGGQTMNPSTEDMLEAVEMVNADNVFILPNNKNIILAAEQAASLMKDTRIFVVPTKTIPQGITALINYNEAASPEENLEAMTESLSTVSSGQVTYAVRNTSVDGKEIREGDIMGIGDKGILAVGQILNQTTEEMLGKMVTEDSELITVYRGEDIKEADAEALCQDLRKAFPACEVELQDGGQPVYYYILSVE